MSRNTDIAGIGQMVYGGGWQTALAKGIGVSDRTVRRWLAGQPIPDGAWLDIVMLAGAFQARRALDFMESLNLPDLPVIELKVFRPDSKIKSPHKRAWSFDTDRQINEVVAGILTEAGFQATVVEL